MPRKRIIRPQKAGRNLSIPTSGFTNGVSTYATATTDGTNVYATVTISGTFTMTATSGCVIPLGAHHYGVATGQLISNSGTKSPGNVGSSAYTCPDCYIDARDEEDLPIDGDDSWEFNYGSQALCTSAGLLSGTNTYQSLRLTVATYKLVTANADGSGSYALACPGTTKATCGAANYHGSQVYNWAEEFGVYYIQGGQSTGECSPIQPVVYLNGPPAPLNCK